MPERARRHRSDSYEHTIAGLLTKRSDLTGEAVTIRDRFVAIKNDIEAIDRVLKALGYEGDFDASMPALKRERVFGHGELSRTIMDALREAKEPLTCREIARITLAAIGQDKNDPTLVADHSRRVSKALRNMKRDRIAENADDGRGNRVWFIAGMAR